MGYHYLKQSNVQGNSIDSGRRKDRCILFTSNRENNTDACLCKITCFSALSAFIIDYVQHYLIITIKNYFSNLVIMFKILRRLASIDYQ
jgi:hypothetical protein